MNDNKNTILMKKSAFPAICFVVLLIWGLVAKDTPVLVFAAIVAGLGIYGYMNDKKKLEKEDSDTLN